MTRLRAHYGSWFLWAVLCISLGLLSGGPPLSGQTPAPGASAGGWPLPTLDMAMTLATSHTAGPRLHTPTDQQECYPVYSLQPDYHLPAASDSSDFSSVTPGQTVSVLLSQAGAELPALSLSSISGRVHERGGVPVAGAEVRLRQLPRDEHPDSIVTTTDETGHYSFSDVPPGRYYVRPHKVGYEFGPSWCIIRVPPSATYINFLAIGTLTVEGYVVLGDRHGEPIPDVDVRAYRTLPDDSLRLFASTTTDDLGRYRFRRVPPGRYVLRVARDGFRFYQRGERVLTVPPSKRDVGFIGVPTSTISGRVYDTTGDRMPGVEVTIVSWPSWPMTKLRWQVTTTDERGIFLFTEVYPGRYWVEPFKDGYGFRSGARPVEVPPSVRRLVFRGAPPDSGRLSDGVVDPWEGTMGTLFTYSVIYCHPENVPPIGVWVVIDDQSPMPMEKLDPTDEDYTAIRYVYQTTLGVGDHAFRYFATHRHGSTVRRIIFPGPLRRDMRSGPTVHSTP